MQEGMGARRSICKKCRLGLSLVTPNTRQEKHKGASMKSRAVQAMRQKLAAGKPVYGLWVTLESASITEMGVALGLDWIVIDAEHGHLDWHDILEHVRTAVRSD